MQVCGRQRRGVDCGFDNNADVVGAINILAQGDRVAACGEPVQSRHSTPNSSTRLKCSHQCRLSQRFGVHLCGKRLVCQEIPGDYAFMQPEFVVLLEKRAGPYLRC
ncbi:hypothetical protein ACUXPM_004574 [Ralstonia sp. 151470066-2]|uniref:hypothetical protein n=1 Tax=Ralstonia insidiosa TaxID=190721 RepID=UPI000B05C4DB|nr:hypothetical protein [Ralstonia insidiosa]UNK01623.1 hypothetical protein MMB19_06860 [Ralstonia insidiosa]